VHGGELGEQGAGQGLGGQGTGTTRGTDGPAEDADDGRGAAVRRSSGEVRAR
jgi:hypothetical protein